MLKRPPILLLLISFSILVNAQIKKIVVAQDGSGQYKTVQAAFNAVPTGNTKPITIYVKKGTYKERLTLDSGKNFVNLIGEDKSNTLLTYNNHARMRLPNGDTINTYTSASFFIYADDFSAQNISFENNAGFDSGQAVAIFAYGNRLKFRNCNITGFQDVLFCVGVGSKQFYENCYIEGTTDFIFGAAVAVFKDCHIHSKKNSHITAASTPKDLPFGFVFFNCKLTADSNINKVSLGRPWRPYSSVTYLNCEMGSHIIPGGWDNWRNPANEQTARYAEFKSFGPGANPEARVKWTKQLTEEEAAKYTLKNIFGDWQVENLAR